MNPFDSIRRHLDLSSSLKAVLAFLFLVFLTACSSDAYIQTDAEIFKTHNASKTVAAYRIGIDDTISINVWRNPELSVNIPVRPDGMISMPLIGDVRAAGFTPAEVSKVIADKLKDFIRNPNVTIIVTELHSHEYLTRVRVTGAVNTPSSLNYRQGMTVLDAVLAAGSVNDFAAPNRTRLYRKIDDKTKIISIYLGDIINKGRLETNIELRPGDIISIPERFF